MDHRAVRRVKPLLKQMLHVMPFLRLWHEKGYTSAPIRRQRFVNWFFKHVFHVNASCRWSVHFTSVVICPERLDIGRDVERSLMLSPGCYVQAGNGIQIGRGTIFGPGVKIISANHAKHNLATWCEEQPIRVGKDCWIGANSIILPGIQLGDGVTVGAGAVVTKNVHSGATVVGNPAHPATPSEDGAI